MMPSTPQREHLSALLKSVASIFGDGEITKGERGTFLRVTVRQYNKCTGRNALADIAAISKNEPVTPFWDSLEGRYFSTVTNGAGPVTAQIRERYELICRSNPLVSGEVCFAEVWNELSDADRDAILQEEASEVARIAAEQEARENETDSERRARIYQTEKVMDKRQLVDLAKRISAGSDTTTTTNNLVAAVRKIADAERQSGESLEKSLGRFWETPEGQVVYRAQKVAKREAIEAPQADAPTFGPATVALHKRADQIRVGKSMTREQAVVKIAEDPSEAKVWRAALAEGRAQL